MQPHKNTTMKVDACNECDELFLQRDAGLRAVYWVGRAGKTKNELPA